jgi:hypothetical protein
VLGAGRRLRHFDHVLQGPRPTNFAEIATAGGSRPARACPPWAPRPRQIAQLSDTAPLELGGQGEEELRGEQGVTERVVRAHDGDAVSSGEVGKPRGRLGPGPLLECRESPGEVEHVDDSTVASPAVLPPEPLEESELDPGGVGDERPPLERVEQPDGDPSRLGGALELRRPDPVDAYRRR